MGFIEMIEKVYLLNPQMNEKLFLRKFSHKIRTLNQGIDIGRINLELKIIPLVLKEREVSPL